MEALKTNFKAFCDYMQTDTRGEEIVIYSISGLMLAVAYHKIRPITKFSKATDIPKHIIRDKVKQYGTIRAIDPSYKSGPVLLVEHKPPLYFLIPSKKLLPVNLTGIQVNANGYSWLQTVAVGKKIEFFPISKISNNVADCQVNMICPKNKVAVLDLSEALLSLGFGKIASIERNIQWKNYYKSLSKVENAAKSKRKGLWLNSLPPQPWPIRKSKEMIGNVVLSMLPVQHRLPELVR